MSGFDLRDKEDVVNDLIKVGEIAAEYREYKSMLNALYLKYNIGNMKACTCRNIDNKLSFQERLNCKKCQGLGYIIECKK